MYNNLLNTSNLLFYSQYQILLFYRLLYYFFTIIIENYKINTNYTYRIKYWGIINKKIPPLNSEVFISSFFLYNIDLQPLTFNPLKHQKSLSTSFTLHSKTQNQNATTSPFPNHPTKDNRPACRKKRRLPLHTRSLVTAEPRI